jgi:hypothetical protein
MRIKLDENLPSSLAAALSALGHDADTAGQEGMQGRADPDVWRGAQHDGRFFITQDLDFSDMRRFRPGTHGGSCWCACHARAAWPYCDGSCRHSSAKTQTNGLAASWC